MSNTANEYLEALFTGVDILIEKRLEDIAFDTTIICTVTDNSNAKNGAYKVTDGSVSYMAYADTDKYSIGDQVRVTVPMGDLTQKKFIAGKYVTDNDLNPITYISPLSKIMDVSGNLVSTNIKGSLVANGNVNESILWSTALDQSFLAMQDNNIYNTLTLKGDFRTRFGEDYDLIAGNYGLRLSFIVSPTAESNVKIRKTVDLDSKDMFGNPYGFVIASPQIKVVKINTMGVIKAIGLTFYQKGNFKDRIHGDIVPFSNSNYDIFVDNIEVGLGCDLEISADNTLQLYTESEPTYKYSSHNNTTNLKTMGLLWINKDDNNQYVGFSDGAYSYDYDEIKYLSDSRLNTRLVEQQGRDKIPLDANSLRLAANIEEAQGYIRKALEVINQDVVQVLRQLRQAVYDIEQFTDNIDLLLSSNKGKDDDSEPDDSKYLAYHTSLISKYLSDEDTCGLVQQYYEILEYGYNVWKDNKNSKWDTNKWTNVSRGKQIVDEFLQIRGNINWLLDTGADGGFHEVLSTYDGFKSIYDTYKIRLEKTLAMAEGYLGIENPNYPTFKRYFPAGVLDVYKDDKGTEKEYTIDHATLQAYKNKAKTDYVVYKQIDLAQDENKYCIYWYRYEKDYEPPDTESFLGNGWRRLTSTELKGKNTKHSIVGDSDGTNVGLSGVWLYDASLDIPSGYVATKQFKEDYEYYIRDTNTTKKKVAEYSLADPQPVKEEVTSTDADATQYYIHTHINEDGKSIHKPKPDVGKGLVKRYMQNDLEEEKYKVILFYNHEMYVSNELVFKNKDVIPDKTTADAGDILIFEHIENSSDDYQSYSITNYLMDASDETKLRQIRCHYDGLLAKDNAFVGGHIYWYVPTKSTMIDIDIEDLTQNKKFAIDWTKSEFEYKEVNTGYGWKYKIDTYYTKSTKDGKDKYSLYRKSANEYQALTKKPTLYEKSYTRYCFYKKVEAQKLDESQITDNMKEWDKWDYTNKSKEKIDNRDFWYTIKPYYEESAQNNYISCEFLKTESSDAVKGEQLFTFGIRGTSGTRYTLAITKQEGMTAATASEGLKLKAELKDFNNKALNIASSLNGTFRAEWDCYYGTDDSKTITTQMENTLPLEDSITFNSHAGYCGILRASAQISLKGTQIEGDETPSEDGTPSEDDVNDSDANNVRTRTVDLDVRYAIPYAASKDYMIKGPTSIIYNSLGTLDSTTMFNTSYELLARRDVEVNKLNNEGKPVLEGGKNVKVTIKRDQSIPNVEWEIIYYVKNSKDGKKTANIKLKNITSLSDKERLFYNQYMPKLDKKNALLPAPLYLDNLDCYAIVVAKREDSVLWRQPIIILQNRYSSSMINDWDGSFQIDEENGTILSSMIGAGRKHPNNNTFEGVLMGNVALGTGSNIGFENGENIGLSNQTGLGLYGFNDGAQSFGFNIDGTAFLGKSGCGRIIFNGNSGTIASANWYTGTDLTTTDSTGKPTYPKGGIIENGEISRASDAGMCIDLDNGQIDAYNFKLTSKNIYLNSTPTRPGPDDAGVKCLSHINDSKDQYGDYYLRIGEEKKTGFIGLDSSGNLTIRVNSLQITGNVGNENLLKQTSPRKTILVPHWVETAEKVVTSYEKIKDGKPVVDANGNPVITQTKSYIYKESMYPDGEDEPVYIYNVSAWKKRVDQKDIDKTTWNYNTQYANGACVNARGFSSSENDYLGNIWKNTSGAPILAKSNPPGNNSNWTPYIDVNEDDDNKPYILDIYGEKTWITQSIQLKKNFEYTVSGYFKIKNPDTTNGNYFRIILNDECSIVYSNLDDDITFKQTHTFEQIKDSNWHYFRCTFKSPNEAAAKRTVGFTCDKAFQLWHPKLEEGSVATAWCPAPDDIEENTESVKNKYDNYLAQDKVFNKLFTDPKTGLVSDGIVMLSADSTLSGRPELYISATYMSTGILRSKNWDGTLKAEYDGLKNGKEFYRYSLKTHPKFGMYINLDEGKIWSAKFELNAWDYDNKTKEKRDDGGHGLYLNSDPEKDGDGNLVSYSYYLKLGNFTKSYITFDMDGNLRIRANSFYLTETLGGANLLKQTNPKKTVMLKKAGNPQDYERDEKGNVKCDWDLSKWSPNRYVQANPQPTSSNFSEKTYYTLSGNVYTKQEKFARNTTYYVRVLNVETEDDKTYIVVNNKPTATNATIQQTVTGLKPSKQYTVSGYAKRRHDTDGDKAYEFTITATNSSNAEGSNKTNKINIVNEDWSYFEYTFTMDALKDDEKEKTTVIKFSSQADFFLWHPKLEKGSVATTWSESDWDVDQNTSNTKTLYDEYMVQDQIFKKLITDPKTGYEMVGIWMVDTDASSTGNSKELYINATYISSGILKSRNWDGTISKTIAYAKDADGNNTTTELQDAHGNTLYTYKIDDEPSRGMYINLDEGKIWAASFELDAWVSGQGIYFNSNPTNNTSYFRIGKENDTELRYWLDDKGNGQFKILAKKFTLSTSKIYLSNTSDNFTINDELRTVVLRMGDNFGVSEDGTLYASDAIISGDIYADYIEADDGEIGGWDITGTTIENGTITLDSSTSTISGGTLSGSEISGGSIEIGGGKGATASFEVGTDGALTATGATITGKLTSTEGQIGGWYINGTSISSGEKETGLVIDSANACISMSTAEGKTIKLTPSGFKTGDNKPYASVDNVIIFTGFGNKSFGKLMFVNGLLVSYTDTNIFGEDKVDAVFKYAASTKAKFKIGDDGAVWASSYTYPKDKNNKDNNYVDADGNFSFFCTIKPPETLYTKNDTDSTVKTQGKEVTVYTLGNQASEGTFHSTAKITYYKAGETVPKGGYSVKGYKEDSYYLYYYGSKKTYYEEGTSASYGNYTKFCDKNSEITGEIKIVLKN